MSFNKHGKEFIRMKLNRVIHMHQADAFPKEYVTTSLKLFRNVKVLTTNRDASSVKCITFRLFKPSDITITEGYTCVHVFLVL